MPKFYKSTLLNSLEFICVNDRRPGYDAALPQVQNVGVVFGGEVCMCGPDEGRGQDDIQQNRLLKWQGSCLQNTHTHTHSLQWLVSLQQPPLSSYCCAQLVNKSLCCCWNVYSPKLWWCAATFHHPSCCYLLNSKRRNIIGGSDIIASQAIKFYLWSLVSDTDEPSRQGALSLNCADSCGKHCEARWCHSGPCANARKGRRPRHKQSPRVKL